MKFAAIMLVSAFMSSAFAAPLARMVSTSDGSFESKIISLYKREAKKPNSPLAKAIAKIAKENDCPASCSISEPTAQDLMKLSSGKASAMAHSFTFLVGVPVFRQGTGMIEEYAGYFQANVYSEMESRDTVTIDTRVDIVEKK